MLFIEYPKCSTCQKAKNWLESNSIEFEDRHIVEENPTFEELSLWFNNSEFELKNLVNSRGTKYRELGLKEKLPEMSEAEVLTLLATDGMLLKRPMVVDGDKLILLGFNDKKWAEALK